MWCPTKVDDEGNAIPGSRYLGLCDANCYYQDLKQQQLEQQQPQEQHQGLQQQQPQEPDEDQQQEQPNGTEQEKEDQREGIRLKISHILSTFKTSEERIWMYEHKKLLIF